MYSQTEGGPLEKHMQLEIILTLALSAI